MVQALGELGEYLVRLLSEKRTRPADDLLSALAERITAGELTQRQAANMGTMLLFAGHETTANMIALGTLALLQHPAQLARVRENSGNPELIASAVEELLRYLTIPQIGRRRVALDDIEIGGVTIRAGESLILAHDIGNRDPAVFTALDRLDIDRNPRRQIAFGFGVHQCLGQPLARLELEVVYSTLYRNLPTLRLATKMDQISYKHGGVLYGVDELPVTWVKQMRTGGAMKLIIDPDKCVSAGQCVLSAPDVFDQREDDGVVVLLVENPSEERADEVREAASLCPARAIHLA